MKTPVHVGADNLWYFWDETWSHEIGPYETKRDANVALDTYVRRYLDNKYPIARDSDDKGSD